MSWTAADGATQCYPLFGVVPVLNTPFDQSLQVDFASLERLVDRTIADGIAGLLVPAVASEVETLSADERREIVRLVATAVKSRVPVIAGVSSDSLAESQRLAAHALGAGCAGILCRAPLDLIGDEAALVDFFSELAAVGTPLMMIQDLAWSGPGLSIPLILRLFDEIPSFKCLKVEIAPAGPKYSKILEATDGRMNISCGWGMPQMIEALDRGVHAFNTTASNRPFVHIYDQYRQGRRREAINLFNRVLPILSWVQQDLLVSIHFFKQYCVRRHEFRTAAVRLPGPPLDHYYQRLCDELLDDLLEIEAELGGSEVAK